MTPPLSAAPAPSHSKESPRIPIGSYTDDPAANARHSADIADMMAERSRGSADRAAASAATALNAQRLAMLAADKAVLAADQSPHDRVTANIITSAAAIIAIVALLEILCAIAIYALTEPVIDHLDTIEYVQTR